MSFCFRCGCSFGCAMMGEMEGPCWCTELPPALPVPNTQAGCLCPNCLRLQIDALRRTAAAQPPKAEPDA